MQPTKDLDPLIDRFVNSVRLFEKGDVTAREVVNEILVDLANGAI